MGETATLGGRIGLVVTVLLLAIVAQCQAASILTDEAMSGVRGGCEGDGYCYPTPTPFTCSRPWCPNLDLTCRRCTNTLEVEQCISSTTPGKSCYYDGRNIYQCGNLYDGAKCVGTPRHSDTYRCQGGTPSSYSCYPLFERVDHTLSTPC
jgi:hypothetical protein